ncbi:MAG: hypothetical protein ACMXYL_05885 [Candidatus Woesearchaeota archaeon]
MALITFYDGDIMNDIYVSVNRMDPYKMLEQLSLGYTYLWPDVVAHVIEGNLRVYDTLRGLERGLEASIKQINEVGDDDGHKDYWESQKIEACKALEAIRDKRFHIVEYNGVSLEKK